MTTGSIETFVSYFDIAKMTVFAAAAAGRAGGFFVCAPARESAATASIETTSASVSGLKGVRACIRVRAFPWARWERRAESVSVSTSVCEFEDREKADD